jgi:hypothetical protein
MCLIGQTAFSRNLAKGSTCCQHQSLSAFDAATHQVPVRRIIEAFPEGSAKVE